MGFSIPKLPEIPKIPSLPNVSDGPVGSLCRKMESSLDIGLDEMGKVRNSAFGALDNLKGALRDLIGQGTTPAGEMTAGLGDLNTKARGAMPSFPVGLDQINDLLKKCGILKKELPSYSGSALYGDYTKDIKDSFDFDMDDFFGDIKFPEFKIGKMFDDLTDDLDFFDFSGLLGKLDGYLNCLDAMCGSNVSGKVDHANYIVDDMSLTAEGNLDKNRLMNDIGVPIDKQNNVTAVTDTTAKNKYDLGQATQNSGDSFVTSMTKYRNELIGAVAPSTTFA